MICADTWRTVTGMAAICPNGHQLRPGHVLVGWSPCGCANCGNQPRGLRGHRTLQCLDCREQGEEMVRYNPPHIGGGHPNRA